jgi:hypothetical protein
MRSRQQFDSVISFGARQVDPSIVAPSFLQRYYDAAIVGNYPSFKAACNAFSQYVGEHTDVLHIADDQVAGLHSAPYSQPQGVPEICCGQEMEFRKVIKRKSPKESVKLRCRLRGVHGPGVESTRLVKCLSIPGVHELMYNDCHRFFVSYWKPTEC